MTDNAEVRQLAEEIRSIGFECVRCGSCCRSDRLDSGVVMVMPAEIREIISLTGSTWSGIAEPFPEHIALAGSGSCTFGWCLRRSGDACGLLDGARCRVYGKRPCICRTYPFVLTNDGLMLSDCPGLGRPITEHDAVALASDLIMRRVVEDADEERILEIMVYTSLDPDAVVVIDCEGVKNIPG